MHSFRKALLTMNVIGLVILQFVVGEGFEHWRSNSNKSSSNNEHDFLFNLITKKLAAHYVKSEVLTRDKCTLRLLKEAVNEFGSTYMFITDDRYHTHLLQSLQINFVHSYYTEPKRLTLSKSETFENLLIFRNKFRLREVIKKKEPFQDTKFFLLVRDYQEAIEKFEILWENRLVNVVASYVENRTVYYYTYFPYCATHCGRVGKPYLLARCDASNGVFSHREKLFPSKVRNLHRCPVSVTFTENVPASYYTETNQLTGWEIDLMNEILERMNGVPNYNVLNVREPIYETERGYGRLVENSEIGGGLAVSLRGLVETDFCMYGMSLCAIWIVPKKEGSPISVDFLTKVFPPGVWILLLLAYIVMAIVIRTFFKVSCSNIIFKLFPYLLGVTTTTKRTSRRLGALWLWFCLIMNATYQSGFHSTLLVPSLPKQISSTHEILLSNLKILGVPDIITDAAPYFRHRYNLSRRRFKNRRLSYEDWIYRMVVKKDSAYLGFKETVLYHVKRTDMLSQIYIQDGCVIKYLLAFVLKRNSHLTETFIKFSNRLNANGFLEYFIRKHLLSDSRENIPQRFRRLVNPIQAGQYNENPLPFNMSKASVVFMGLAGGILLGLATFLGELMSTWDWKKIRKRVIRELQYAWPCN